MRRRLGQALRIGVGAAAVSLLRTSRWGDAPLTVLAEAVVPAVHAGAAGHAAALGAALDALLAGQDCAGWPVSFVLADELLRLWQVTPPPGAVRQADLEAAAALRFQTLYGEPAADWKTVAGWDSGAVFFAAAAPRALLAALEQGAAAHQLAVVDIVPHFIHAWNRWQAALKPGAWFGLMHEQLLTVGAVHGRRLRAVRVLALPHGAEHYWLTQTLQREALLLDLAAPSLLQVCGQVGPQWRRPPVHAEHIASLALEPAPAEALAGLSPVSLLALGGGWS